MTMIFLVYIKFYSSDQVYDLLDNTISKSTAECEAIFSDANGVTFYEEGKYSCGLVDGNREGSYLTMLSRGGLMFGIINIVGNFGTVFVDQSYWQSAIAARPESAARGYLLGGYVDLLPAVKTSANDRLLLLQNLLVRHSVLSRHLSRTCLYGSHASHH